MADDTRTRRKLGRSGLEVTPIGLGTWQFSEGRGGARSTWSPLSEGDTDQIVRAALDGGIDWFDTAELYGYGRSEAGLARGLLRAGRNNGDVVIATKWNPLLRTAPSIRNTVGNRLKFLNPFGIDLYQVHFPASFSSIESEMKVMADLIEAGTIRAAGVSNYSADQMRRAHQALVNRGFVLASNQVKYSVLDRRIERNGVLEAARELEITIIAYSPLEMGLLSGRFQRDPNMLRTRPFVRRLRLLRLVEKSRPLVSALEEIARDHNATASQAALNWVLNFHGPGIVAIPGATKGSHARESASAMDFALSRKEMMQIDRLSAAMQP
jgi:aryl-alcohol dehydrogenase-like predicted oxidoreductase